MILEERYDLLQVGRLRQVLVGHVKGDLNAIFIQTLKLNMIHICIPLRETRKQKCKRLGFNKIIIWIIFWEKMLVFTRTRTMISLCKILRSLTLFQYLIKFFCKYRCIALPRRTGDNVPWSKHGQNMVNSGLSLLSDFFMLTLF